VVIFIRITGNDLKVTCIGGSLALCESLLKHGCHSTTYVLGRKPNVTCCSFLLRPMHSILASLPSFLYRSNSLNRLHHAGIQTEKAFVYVPVIHRYFRNAIGLNQELEPWSILTTTVDNRGRCVFETAMSNLRAALGPVESFVRLSLGLCCSKRILHTDNLTE